MSSSSSPLSPTYIKIQTTLDDLQNYICEIDQWTANYIADTKKAFQSVDTMLVWFNTRSAINWDVSHISPSILEAFRIQCLYDITELILHPIDAENAGLHYYWDEAKFLANRPSVIIDA